MVAHGCRLRSCCQKLEAGQAVGPYTWLTDAVRGRMHKVAGLRAKKCCTRLQVSGPKSFAQGCRAGGSVAYRVLGTRLQGCKVARLRARVVLHGFIVKCKCMV